MDSPQVRVFALSLPEAALVKDLVKKSWQAKAPKTLLRELEGKAK